MLGAAGRFPAQRLRPSGMVPLQGRLSRRRGPGLAPQPLALCCERAEPRRLGREKIPQHGRGRGTGFSARTQRQWPVRPGSLAVEGGCLPEVDQKLTARRC